MTVLRVGDDVLLRPLRAEDLPDLVAAVRESLDHLGAWMPWAVPDYGAPEAMAFLELVQSGQEDAYAIRSAPDEALRGVCALNRFDSLNRTASVGYWLRADAVGRGLATRATAGLLVHGFEDLGLERVELLAAVDNDRSIAVARRLGLSEEGRRAHALRLHDRQLDAVVFAALRADLPALRRVC